MIIQDSLTIQAIQDSFHAKYPGLKIEMYKKSHGNHKGSLKEDQYESSLKLYEIRTNHGEGDLHLPPHLTVEEVESMFEELYGLHVQVFRRSNNLWLQTSKTDHWTLTEQNRKGLHSTTA